MLAQHRSTKAKGTISIVALVAADGVYDNDRSAALAVKFDWENWRSSACAATFLKNLPTAGWQNRRIVGNRSMQYFKCRDMGMAWRPIVLAFAVDKYVSRLSMYNVSLAGLIGKTTRFPLSGLTVCIQHVVCENELLFVAEHDANVSDVDKSNFWCSVLLPTFLSYRYRGSSVMRSWMLFALSLLPPEPHECSAVLVDIAKEWRSDAFHLGARSDAVGLLPPSVAVCITGQARSFTVPEVHVSIRENLLRSLNASLVRIFYVLNLTSQYSTHTYENVSVKAGLGDVLAAVKAVGLDITASIDFEPSCCWPRLQQNQSYNDCFFDNRGCGAFYRTKRLCASNIRSYEDSYGVRFDWIFFARPDLVWRFPVGDIRRFSHSALYLASYSCYQISDMYQLVPRKLLPIILDVFGNIEDDGWTCLTEQNVATSGCIFGSCGCQVERYLEARSVPTRSLERLPYEITEVHRIARHEPG